MASDGEAELLLCFRKILRGNELLTLNPNTGTDYSGIPYPFGMDPVRQNVCTCNMKLSRSHE